MMMYTIPNYLKVCPLCGGKLDYIPHPRCKECHEEFEYDPKYQVFRNPNVVDISYKNPESSLLSNLYPHAFQVWGIKYASMEAFLRGLCWNGYKMVLKNEIAPLFGIPALNVKYVLPDWKEKQELYYYDTIIPRESERYQEILELAYDELYDNSRLFRMALFKTKGKILIHSIGKMNPKETLLTQDEFIRLLNREREKL